jgi:putative membrane protein
MMSWLRTATALISFGFSIDQYLSRVRQTSGAHRVYFPYASQYSGLALIASGIISLLISIWQYSWMVSYLRDGSFSVLAGAKEAGMPTPVLAVAVFPICIGLFAFFCRVAAPRVTAHMGGLEPCGFIKLFNH